MAKAKILQVGIGGFGISYLTPMLEEWPSPRYELVGAVDPLARLSPLYEALLEKGVPIFDTMEDFYKQDSADLVIVAAPIGFHRQYTVYALVQGSNVLCEKPVCGTLEELDAMQAAQEKSGRFAAVGFQWSFAPAMLEAKKDFLSGLFGRAERFKVHVLWRRDAAYFGRNNWAGKLRDGQGRWILDSVAHNAAAHYLHNPYFMHGSELAASASPASIQCELYRANDIENFDTCALRAVTGEGCEVLYLATHAVTCHTPPTLTYAFENATLHLNSDPSLPQGELVARFADGRIKRYGSPERPMLERVHTCLNAMEHGVPLPCTLETARPHLLTINFIADHFPIRDFPEGMTLVDGRGATYVPGLEEIMLKCYEKGQLPSEAGAPWATAEPMMDIGGYNAFRG